MSAVRKRRLREEASPARPLADGESLDEDGTSGGWFSTSKGTEVGRRDGKGLRSGEGVPVRRGQAAWSTGVQEGMKRLNKAWGALRCQGPGCVPDTLQAAQPFPITVAEVLPKGSCSGKRAKATASTGSSQHSSCISAADQPFPESPFPSVTRT